MKKILLIIIVVSLFCNCTGIVTYNKMKSDFYIRIGDNNNIKAFLNIDGYYQINLAFRDNTTFTSYFMLFEDGSYSDQIFFDLDTITQKPTNIKFSNYEGFYRLCGDAIKIQAIFKGVGLTASDMFEIWYKIIDRNTLKVIYHSSYSIEDYSLATFVPLDAVPFFDCSLKRDKFFWKNKEDLEAYMEKIKIKK